MISKKHIVLFFVTSFLFLSCNEKKKYEDYQEEEFPLVEELVSEEVQTEAIFYSLDVPVEMSRVFENLQAIYDEEILNPPENATNYTSSHKAAINLGVYGVDFSYTKMFEQNQRTYDYLASLHKLSKQLGIPDEFFGKSADEIESHFKDQDTLMHIIRDVFIKTDRYLKEQERGNAAAFIVLGGWIESIYIASEIYAADPENKAALNRIAKQKYSLNSLMSFLYNYQGDMTMAKYIMMLKLLKSHYDSIAMVSKGNEIEIDTTQKSFTNETVTIHYTDETMIEIIKTIHGLRYEMIN